MGALDIDSWTDLALTYGLLILKFVTGVKFSLASVEAQAHQNEVQGC